MSSDGEDEEPRIKIELTAAQRELMRQVGGKAVSSLELTAEELEDRVAPNLTPLAPSTQHPNSPEGFIPVGGSAGLAPGQLLPPN